MLRRGFSQFLGFELFFRVLAVVVFAPLTAWLAARIIAWSGETAISNYDLAGFLMSPKGLLYLLVIATLTFALVFFELGGLTALGIALQREDKIRLPQLLRFLLVSLPDLWKLSVRQFLVYFAWALPSLAVAGGAYLVFLTKNDIYYYLTVKPPAYWIAASLIGVAGLAFAAVSIRISLGWILSVPILLFTEATPVAALSESRRSVVGHRLRVFKVLLVWAVSILVLFGAEWLLVAGLRAVLMAVAGNRVGLVLTSTAALAVLQFLLGAVVGIVAMSSLALIVARQFLRLYPDAQLPTSLSGADSAILRRVNKILRAGWAMVLILGGFTIWTALRMLETVTFEESVGVTAHRGSSLTAPENTMAAILRSVDEGTDVVEIDVQETSDGVVVLAHDKDWKRVLSIDKGVWEVSYQEIKDLDSGSWFKPEFSDQRISTLDQVIEAVKGKTRLNIEMKFNGHEKQLAAETVRIVNDHDFGEDCILTSLDYAGMLRARAAGPDLRTGIIVTSSIGDITGLETDLLSVSAKAVNRNMIAHAHSRDLEVHAWTVNDVPTMNTLIGMGIDHIITDDPGLLRELLEERASLSYAERILIQLGDYVNGR